MLFSIRGVIYIRVNQLGVYLVTDCVYYGSESIGVDNLSLS